MPIKVVARPTGEQITLSEARLHLRLDDDGDSPAAHPDDPWLTGVGIPAAREYCEQWMSRALAPQTIELALDVFPLTWRNPYGTIYLPMAPVTQLLSVKYTDGDDVLRTVSTDDYEFDDFSDPQLIRPLANTAWPLAKTITNAVRIRYEAGYSLPGDSPDTNPLPFALKAAMLLVLGALYENREDQAEAKLERLPLGAIELMTPYKLRLSMA